METSDDNNPGTVASSDATELAKLRAYLSQPEALRFEMLLTATVENARLRENLQALEIMLRPGDSQANATIAHTVLVSWMQQDGIRLFDSDGNDNG